MIKVHIMVGVSASGKTTMSKSIVQKENATRISSDEIRLDFINRGVLDMESGFSPDGHALVFKTLYDKARELVQQGKDILIDAQNLRMKYRQVYFKALEDFDCYFIAHVMMTEKSECERRYAQRDLNECFYPSKVPQRKTMDDRFRMFEMPTKQEGFDEIRLITEEQQSENFNRRRK